MISIKEQIKTHIKTTFTPINLVKTLSRLSLPAQLDQLGDAVQPAQQVAPDWVQEGGLSLLPQIV